jgi:DNA-binding XRE family transcriptional regulator
MNDPVADAKRALAQAKEALREAQCRANAEKRRSRVRKRPPKADACYVAIGQVIREKRLAIKNMSQTDLAKLVGAYRGSVYLIESGDISIPIHRLYDYAKALNCTVADLLKTIPKLHGEDAEL